MSKGILLRPLTAIVIMAHLGMAIAPAGAQTSNCSYDRRAPSLAHARMSFQEFDFVCADQEVTDLLKSPSLDPGVQADAHALLAAIYFQTLPDDQRRREKVIEAFRKTYSLRPDWRGQVEIQTPAFRDLMTEAKRQVDMLSEKTKPVSPAPSPTAKAPPKGQQKEPERGGGSRKTWIYAALGATAVGVAVLALSGGGGAKGDKNLPDFPPPPGGSNK